MNGSTLNSLYNVEPSELSLSALGMAHIFSTGGGNVVTIQAALAQGTSWGSGVLTVERSNNGVDFVALASPVTISSNQIVSIVPDTLYLRVRVSTAGTAGVTVKVHPYVSGSL